jgi:phosphoesterase RecJ-like protein
VSLRSDGSVDVSRIASGFGGGGHAGAAGFSMETSLAELKKTIYSLSEGLSGTCHLN